MLQDAYGVWNGDHSVTYADGHEDRVLEALLAAQDRSDGSDELLALVDDWPSAYHFSPLRANVLRPIEVRPTDRILEIGCGSGALSRWLSERGAHVLSIDGNQTRARAAATRVRDLDNVRVMAGTLEDVPTFERFDLVIVVGVLEYTAIAAGGQGGTAAFLTSIARVLAPTGAMVLAIENQLGLKYLIGYDEDHRAIPWVGVEGYLEPGPRTWSRRQLAHLLDGHGFRGQTWMYPFPDYKHPVAVLHDRLYDRPDHPALIDAFVRRPVTDDASRRNMTCDARAAHRTMLDAGLGRDVANSFLVVATLTDEPAARVAVDPLLWYFGASRRRQWRRTRVLCGATAGALALVKLTDDVSEERRWLRQAEPVTQAVVSGRPLDRLLVELMAAGDRDGVRRHLTAWADCLVQATAIASRREHPFAAVDGEDALAPDHIDIMPSNFMVDHDALTFVDREWQASGPVSRSMVMIRAMWWFASEVVDTGCRTPWGAAVTVDELCLDLLGSIGVYAGTAELDRVLEAEAELQGLVNGPTQDASIGTLKARGRRCAFESPPGLVPISRLRLSLGDAREALDRTIVEFDEQRGAHRELESSYRELELSYRELETAYDDARSAAQRLLVELGDAERRFAVADAGRRASSERAAETARQLVLSESLLAGALDVTAAVRVPLAQLQRTEDELDAMRATLSWRSTRWMRVARRRVPLLGRFVRRPGAPPR